MLIAIKLKCIIVLICINANLQGFLTEMQEHHVIS